MNRPRLFSWWQRLTLLLCLLAVIAQGWLLGGHAFWIVTTPSRSVPLKNVGDVVRRYRPVQKRPTFQTGVVFPQWGKDSYSRQDRSWGVGLQEIGTETGARWIAMTINFTQVSVSSTHVQAGLHTPSPQAFAEGIRLARSEGYSIFVQPLITVLGARSWAGSIQFTDEQKASAWFASYWQVYQPYITAAAQAGANELALGTEYEHLQVWTVEWNRLIAHARLYFPGVLTYDMNWTSLGKSTYPSWMLNPALAFIGVSTYISLTNVPERLSPAVLPALWRAKIGTVLDAFSKLIGKPVLISEIGYRNSSDALYHPANTQRLPGTDPQEQAAAYNAALQNALIDTHLAGIFFWAWSLPPFAPNGELAASTLLRWYTSPVA